MAAKGNMEVTWCMLNLCRLKSTLLSTSGHFGERASPYQHHLMQTTSSIATKFSNVKSSALYSRFTFFFNESLKACSITFKK